MATELNEAKGPPSTARRDALIAIEKRVQAAWESSKVYEVDPQIDEKSEKEKFFGTFPYPYMNGVLHLGHGFSLSKLEFQCRFQKLKGKQVLFPFGFHCTGMPIMACANKLAREMEVYGCPPKFPVVEKKEEESEPVVEEKAAPKMKVKAKLAKKASGEVYQWNILREMGVPEAEIPKFADPSHWLKYFPPIGKDHLKAFGLSADFRRSFITTDLNPYYNRFIEWQFNTLNKLDKVAFGNRLTIFSPKENQPCADHDRASGEGAKLVDYTLIKLKLQEPYPAKLQALLDAAGESAKNKSIILPAATLRPETMYGQTNCWLLPEGEYGVFDMNDSEIFICAERAAFNMTYQDLGRERGKLNKVGSVLGQDLLGFPVKAPYAQYDQVYILPLTTIKMNKGTGVVTSVPSDAPDDYSALMDLKNKQPFRQKFGLKDEQVLPFDVIPIINTPGLGTTPAKDLCIEAKVASQNDREKLEKIKDQCYLTSFTSGVMLVGKYAGKKVSEAKPLIKQDMIAEGFGYAYSEPDTIVMSRSGVECVVAKCDQWYLKYGEEKWQHSVKEHIDRILECYNPLAKKMFQESIEWLHEWACSRTFGLGTLLPWDKKWVIESLSDSTIYMAYYTIAHYLQGDMNGTKPGSANIKAEDLTDEVFDYIFLAKDPSKLPATSIPAATLQQMRSEFRFWYPMDLRTSGKDLIPNHLTMSLYNHAAIWQDEPEMWPRSFFTNGHVLINNEKMSKSTGNFLTIEQAVAKYSTDATRFALADAGDSLEDANFVDSTANAAILRLTRELDFLEQTLADKDKLRTGPFNFYDQVFDNEMNILIGQCDQAYKSMLYRDALKFGVFDFAAARDQYRASISVPMHKDLILRYFQVYSILLSPICPHFAQELWEKQGQSGFILNARFPEAAPADLIITRKIQYLREVQSNLRKSLQDKLNQAKKKKDKTAPDVVLNFATLFVAESYPQWQKETIEVVSKLIEEAEKAGKVGKDAEPDGRTLAAAMRANPILADEKTQKNAMTFAAALKADFVVRGKQAFEQRMPFEELPFLQEHLDFVIRDSGVTKAEAKAFTEGDPSHPTKAPTPGRPAMLFSQQ